MFENEQGLKWGEQEGRRKQTRDDEGKKIGGLPKQVVTFLLRRETKVKIPPKKWMLSVYLKRRKFETIQ